MAKFEECFDKAFDAEKERYFKEGLGRFAVEPKTAKILAFFWNVIASGDGTFDDIVHIDKNNNIISQPVVIAKKAKAEPLQKKGKTKKSSKKTADPELNEGANADNSGDQTT